MSAFDALIASAPDEEDEPPPPEPLAAAPAPGVEEKKEAAIDEDTFYQDPLIQAALEKFEARILGT